MTSSEVEKALGRPSRVISIATAVRDRPVVFARHPLQQAGAQPVNIRRVKADVSIEDLAASIARLLTSSRPRRHPRRRCRGPRDRHLQVRPAGRASRALELLVKQQKRLAKIARCRAWCASATTRCRRGSLAGREYRRAPLHPLDQFRAFQDMRVKGKTEEDIAAALFVPFKWSTAPAPSRPFRPACSTSMPRTA